MWPFGPSRSERHRRETIELLFLLLSQGEQMALNLAALTQAVTDCKASADKAVAILTAPDPDQPAVDAVTAQIQAITSSLNSATTTT